MLGISNTFDAKVTSRRTLLALAAAAAVLPVGCGPFRGGPLQQARVIHVTLPHVTLPRATANALRRYVNQPDAASTPRGALLKFWSYVLLGSPRDAITMYDARVRGAVDASALIAGLNWNLSTYRASDPEVIRVTDTRAGTLLRVRLMLPQPSNESFLMDRQPGGWRILFDTLMARALSAESNAAAKAFRNAELQRG